ncbi:MAG: DUF4197 domain-containing protein [Fimbriimonadaceae bacterium]|nr:DUF4197 domain-containing protein [Chitinophagales bacterium]
MKKLSLAFIILLSTSIFTSSCDELNLDDLTSELTDEEVIAGLKEALNVGTDTAVTQGSKFNGYYGNALIKIAFPEEASVVETVLASVPGGDELIDILIEKLNRAAEDAADKAMPIFKDAIVGISFDDAWDILNGEDTAATNYLRINTFSSLYDAFKPDIQESLESVGAQQAWEDVIDLYNSIPFTDDVDTDLANYTTNKALGGLFVLVGQEEEKIRTDVSHQVTDLLEKVFGS